VTGKGTYFRVGIFVLASMALIVLGVIAFGVGLTGSRAAMTVETYVDTSVQGLEAGAKVRNKGVEVGRVKRISFIDAIYDVSDEFILESGRWVLIRITLFKDALPPDTEDDWDLAVATGLRVRITSSGLTGGKYLDMDLLDPERNPVQEFPWEPKKPYLPSAPSAIAKVMESVDKLSRKLEDAPIAEIIEDAKAITASLRTSLEEADVAGLTDRTRVVLDDAHRLLQNPDIPIMLANLRETSENANAMVARLNTDTSGDEVGSTLANLKEATEGLPQVTENLNRTLRRLDFLLLEQQGDLDRSVRDLRVILSDFREFMATGKQYPSWVVFGDPPAPTEPEEQP